MLHLINALPWYFWVLLGAVGIPITLKLVIQSKNFPVIFRISWVMFASLMLIALADNLIKGTGKYTSYSPILIQVSIPLIVLAYVSMMIGVYQIVNRPGYDPVKRRMCMIGIYLMTGVLVSMGLIFLVITYI